MLDNVSDWHHAPLHIFSPNTTYMVTAGTLHKRHFYRGHHRPTILQQILVSVLSDCSWELLAWAVFSNHYHFIARAPTTDGNVGELIQTLHSEAAIEVNRIDGTPSRQVWFQYWDKCLTFEKSYYPRLHYVIKNPVHHGLVHASADYPFCSATSFERRVQPAFRRKVMSFKFDRIEEPDEFEPSIDWQA